jgi:hypothetical protein
MDAITQQKRQKLFYSSIPDILATAPDQKFIHFDLSVKVYQESNELDGDEAAVSSWRAKSYNYWKQWKLNSICCLVADSSFAYNMATKNLVELLGIRLASVSDNTVLTLQNIMGDLWRQSEKGKQSQVHPQKNFGRSFTRKDS